MSYEEQKAQEQLEAGIYHEEQKNNKKLQSDAEGNCPFQKSLPCYHWDKCFNPCGAIPHR